MKIRIKIGLLREFSLPKNKKFLVIFDVMGNNYGHEKTWCQNGVTFVTFSLIPKTSRPNWGY